MDLPDPLRRGALALAASFPFTVDAAVAPGRPQAEAAERLAAIEAASAGRLGVAALDTGRGTRLLHRGDERFPMCSTVKVMIAAAILKRSENEGAGWLKQRIPYAARDLVSHSPATQPHAGKGMPADELCAAAIQLSDNTAANVLAKRLGGPGAVTAFARSIGDTVFRLGRWETELNTALPGDPRDTTTPVAMAASLQRLVLGDALAPPQRARLADWLRGSQTGAERIRAGVPANWTVGDKTGTGAFGSTNDIAVLWPPARAPIVLAVYFTQAAKDAPPRSEVLARVAEVVVQAFG